MAIVSIPAPLNTKIKIDNDDYIKRYTAEEWTNVKAAMAADPELTKAFDMLLMSTERRVTLSSDTVIQLHQYLVLAGLLTPERAAAISSTDGLVAVL